MGNLVFQATLGGQVNLVGPNTASTYNLNVPAVAGTLVTTGDTATVTNTMISGPVSIAKGGTNQTAFTSPAASVNGLVWFDGTSFQNDTSPAHVGYNASTNTFNCLNLLSTNDGSINGLTVGKGAGAVSTNTAVGLSALAANTSGDRSVAIGGNALLSNTSGVRNVAVGYNSVATNTTGSYNVGVGEDALNANTTGANNTAIGYLSLYQNTTASNNTAVGYQALYSQNGSSPNVNTAVGYQAGYTNATGGADTYLGYQAGYVATGSYNTFVGYNSGSAVTSGQKNTILGSYTGNQGGLDIRTASNYIVLSDGDGNPTFSVSNTNSRQIYMPATSSIQVGQGEKLWSNVSSIATDLATLFPAISFTSKGISVQIQVYIEASSATGSSYFITGVRNSGGTWAFSNTGSVTAGGTTVTASGSGTTVTLTFGTGGQYGIASFNVVTR